ncbi:TIGR04283 family arsenosugar biosynthesis glycosyltransferase [Desulfomicrobium baculatum]|uniref:Glycosyl transferase family 2 n=1 Tax=Desulfomicrobium baculatum (strain DSM 4028 / VKM B-1378 / X) TaxID=525897 RepID=C7LUI1_DESBD|nr:TIGR04283 family arsenosugar biosynthesis glycosyltransferase [Desulfomicrobium baculatum]ACU89716.1 glycosyl transferase family 2 [Desulfomicrobium baculatum DSM 4028]
MKISVVIPVFREKGIAALLEDLLRQIHIEEAGTDTEILVVDGAPEADTLTRIGDTPVLRLSSPPGRGVQLNHGAAAAGGDVLLFLHADTLLPANAFTLIRQTLRDTRLSGGAFSLRYEPRTPGLSFIAALANLRSRRTRVPYGDQAIFVRRSVFEELNGFAPIPIMEDLEFMTRLRRQGHNIRILAMPVRTSARRQLREGILRCTLRNLCLRLFYHCGVPPKMLASLYRRHEG